MPAFGKLRQDALEFMARLCYTDKLCLKHKINRNHYKFTKKIQFSLTGDKLGTKP